MRSNRPLESSRVNPEAGNVLVISLLVLFLLTSLGVTYIAVTKGDKQIAGNQMIQSQAFSNAEAGIAEVLLRMSFPGQTGYMGQTPPNFSPGWGRYVVNDPGSSPSDPQYDVTLTDALDNDLDAATDETSEHYLEMGSKQNGMALSSKLDYPWVKVRYKLNAANQIILFGDDDLNASTPPRENTVRGVPVIIIASAGRKGLGNRIVTVEAVKWPLPPVQGSVYTEGAMTFNGNAFYIDGHDHNYTAPYDTVGGSPPLPGISTPNDPNAIESQLNGQQGNNVQGTGSDPSVETAPVNLDLAAMAAAWSDMADITLVGNQNNPNTSAWGTVTTNPPTLKIVHVAGNLVSTGTASGAGVLVIDGDFNLGGTFNWNGIVICLGNVMVTGGGYERNIIGALMVQGSVTGSSALNGNIKLLYSSAMISQLSSLTRYEVSSWIDQ